MKKISKLIILLFTCVIAIAAIELPKKKKKKKQPNLIVVMVDDLGYADVGFNGCQDIPTPNIDRIADEGVRFDEGYVSFPVCGPSRAGFLTGRYQDRFGFTTNPSINPSNPTSGLPTQEETMASVLKKADYSSAIIGKWHMGTHPNFHPLKRGFDYFYGFLSGGHHYLPELITLDDLSQVTKKWEWYSTKLKENYNTVEVEDYLTDELTDAAIRYIKRQTEKDQHFMVYLAYNAPHAPLEATEKYLSRFPNIENKRRKTYAAMVSAVDDGVGRVLKTLEEEGIDENTLVVFLSDNGGSKKNASQNGSLKGWKTDMFEGGVRVPFAMRWKGTIPAKQNYTNPISSLDIMATIVAQNDIKINKERPLDGVDLIPFLTGKNEGVPHDFLFWRKWEQNCMAVRNGQYKLLANKNLSNNPTELYNITKDPNETKNIKEEQEIISEKLMKEWSSWNAQMKDRVFPTLSKDNWWLQSE